MFLDSFIDVQSFLHFIYNLDSERILHYFWAFIVIDMPRYLLLDLLVLFVYIPMRGKRARRNKIARTQLFHDRPLISVIVPGKNEGKHLAQLAESMRQQTYSKIELIIVDDGSDDDTPLICSRLKKKGLIDHFIRNEERGGKASAANTALAYARGRFIIHLDADAHINNDAVERIILPFFVDPSIGIVGGDVRVRNDTDSITTRLQAIEYMKGISVGRTIASMLGVLRIVSGAFGAFRADVLRDLKGWDVGPGLDGDITLKFRNLGWRVYHEPAAVCYTHVPDTPRKLAKQRVRWDRSIVRFRVRKHLDIIKISKNFRIPDFIAVAENIFSTLFLNFLWWLYVFQIVFMDTEYLGRIVIINYLLYFTMNVISYVIAMKLSEKNLHRNHYALAWYLPLMPFYVSIYIRSIRTYAYLSEFFDRASYHDPWNPWKVSQAAKKDGL